VAKDKERSVELVAAVAKLKDALAQIGAH
jgi:hypothetical protein